LSKTFRHLHLEKNLTLAALSELLVITEIANTAGISTSETISSDFIGLFHIYPTVVWFDFASCAKTRLNYSAIFVENIHVL